MVEPTDVDEIEKLIKSKRENIKIESPYQELLKKSRIGNPHLALISDHLWWIALGTKLAILMAFVSILRWLGL